MELTVAAVALLLVATLLFDCGTAKNCHLALPPVYIDGCLACEPYCNNPNPGCELVSANCPEHPLGARDCVCKPGFLRNATRGDYNIPSSCVLPSQCPGGAPKTTTPAPASCPAGSHQIMGCARCEPTCDFSFIDPSCPVRWTDCPDKRVCVCEPGMMRTRQGTCVLPQECPPKEPTCPGQYEMLGCFNCEPTCQFPQVRPCFVTYAACPRPRQCVCEPGTLRSYAQTFGEATICVLADQCPKPDSDPEGRKGPQAQSSGKKIGRNDFCLGMTWMDCLLRQLGFIRRRHA
ncbi:multiple epidermal growth factor-like domains protein 6 [Paramacrobiotus metropolitanus]|uniref:multiple epidermal growth factor-like domains protein 6 n=1 Tax=Paramacrobiotus metropolitanus TaxID=2943436 RepID=UPI00244575BD|nr:multiple epidermal growth factor-like domains protein 6 [Paramacrobiotus metropolitanus]